MMIIHNGKVVGKFLRDQLNNWKPDSSYDLTTLTLEKYGVFIGGFF